jgi:hypothetical protein
MSYMSCPHCGLSIHLRAAYLTLERCPRCLARRGTTVPMQAVENRLWPSPASDPARRAVVTREGGHA